MSRWLASSAGIPPVGIEPEQALEVGARGAERVEQVAPSSVSATCPAAATTASGCREVDDVVMLALEVDVERLDERLRDAARGRPARGAGRADVEIGRCADSLPAGAVGPVPVALTAISTFGTAVARRSRCRW